ncbi:MAG: PDZ domain-containing protein [Actinomycetota bacterium]|nr:PDZ domain-containing protein [Actinomycetota bacterium]
MSDYSDWNSEDDDENSAGYIPPDDRIWLHPSESGRIASGQTYQRKNNWQRLWATFLKRPITMAALFLMIGLGIGGASTSISSNPKTVPATSSATAIELPSGLSSKINSISQAVTTMKTTKGGMWEAATYVGSSNLLVTTAEYLKLYQDVLLQNTSKKGKSTWITANVTAIDPLTNAAVLTIGSSSHAFVPTFSTDTPPTGALEEIVTPNLSGSKKLVSAEIVSRSTAISVSNQIYIPNGIALSIGRQTVPLGSLVLDPEGDPVGIVTDVRTSSQGNTAYATPMPSLINVANLVNSHQIVAHGYLGIVGVADVTELKGSTIFGIKVESIDQNSPADNAAIAVGAFIISVDGIKVTSMQQLQTILQSKTPGTTVYLGLIQGGQEREMKVVLSAHPNN